MGKFDDVLVNARDIASGAGAKVNEGASVLKLKFDLTRVKKDIKKEYQEIGEKYYISQKCPEVTFDCSKQIENINFFNDQIDTLETKIAEAKKLKRCMVCNNFVDNKSEYCPICGNKF